MSAFIVEAELGMPPRSIDDVRGLVAGLPFEPTMLHIAVLMGRLHPVLADADGHWALAQVFYGTRPELLDAYQDVLQGQPGRVLFSPQVLMMLMRLVLDEARDELVDDDLDPTEFAALQDAVLGAHSALERSLDVLALPTKEQLLAYEVQGATLFRRPQPLEEMARHQEFLRLATVDSRLSDSANRVPVESWYAAAGMRGEDQWTVGFGLAAMTQAFDKDVRPRITAEHIDDLLNKLGLPAASRDIPVISASRAELRVAFAALEGAGQALAWEQRPFKSTPFLRLARGDLVLLSPSWLLSWLGEGFHYRALKLAQHHGPEVSARYSRLAGEVTERYALDLAETAFNAPSRVLGEQPYGKGGGRRTTDLSVIAGTDVFLFEIHARRVTAAAAVTGGAADAMLEVSRLLVHKIGQVGLCTAALLSGEARLPSVDFAGVQRVWPIVVSVGHVMQTRTLWQYLRGAMDPDKTECFSDPRVQPLQVLDIEDFERLMGMVEAGEDLCTILSRKVAGPFRERDFAAWLHGDPGAPPSARMTVLKERWERIGELALISNVAGDTDAE